MNNQFKLPNRLKRPFNSVNTTNENNEHSGKQGLVLRNVINQYDQNNNLICGELKASPPRISLLNHGHTFRSYNVPSFSCLIVIVPIEANRFVLERKFMRYGQIVSTWFSKGNNKIIEKIQFNLEEQSSICIFSSIYSNVYKF
jgi:hypothetical protein